MYSISKKRKLKRIGLGIAVIFLVIIIVYLVYYFVIIRPKKNEISDIAINYVTMSNTMFILPKEYQDNPALMPKSEIEKLKRKISDVIEQNILKNSKLYDQESSVYFNIIQDQILGTYLIRDTQVKDIKDIKVKIYKDEAIVSFVASQYETIRKNNVELQNVSHTRYRLGLVYTNSKWMIAEFHFEPIDI